MDLSSLWDRILTGMHDRIGHQDVQIWFASAQPVKLEGGRLVVEVENSYYADWIAENYHDHLRAETSGGLGRPADIDLVTPGDDGAHEPGSTPEGVIDRHPRAVGVNEAQTFESFVVGECNKFAHAAASAVADYPATQYNPLFIYGPTGLGKTHLMHAIANRVLERHPDSRVLYVTAEDFLNEMIKCLRHKRMEDFRNKYRKRATVLLVDDVHFLSGKEGTQEEFFHTFNALQTSGRQIVLTSDVEPRDIDKLEPRLRTRFEGGLLADLQAPDRETLLAILDQKAEAHRLVIPPDLADAIANSVAGNIRELEGVLNRLAALHSFYNQPLTLDFARKQLPTIFDPEPPLVTVAGIIESVAKFHNVRSADITGTKRTRSLSNPRHIAMFLARKHTRLSFPELGREFGGRDHSTIQHGVRKVEQLVGTDPDVAYKIKLIEQNLNLVARH